MNYPQSTQYSVVELITPEIAETYLATIDVNRRVDENKVRQYAREILNGVWELTHQGIAFNESGVLIDGQHRLRAVVLADTSVQMVVTRNCKNEARRFIDIGRKRTKPQQLQVEGYDVSSREKSIFTAMFIDVEKQTECYSSLTDNEEMDLIIKYHEGLKFASRTFAGSSSILQAGIRAIVCRAYYAGYDKERLAQFLECLDRGLTGAKIRPVSPDLIEGSTAIETLRKYYVDTKLKSKGTLAGRGARIDLARRTVTVLKHFLEEKPLTTKPQTSSKQYFKVPEIDEIIKRGKA